LLLFVPSSKCFHCHQPWACKGDNRV
jgi:hypothetical protein